MHNLAPSRKRALNTSQQITDISPIKQRVNQDTTLQDVHSMVVKDVSKDVKEAKIRQSFRQMKEKGIDELLQAKVVIKLTH